MYVALYGITVDLFLNSIFLVTLNFHPGDERRIRNICRIKFKLKEIEKATQTLNELLI